MTDDQAQQPKPVYRRWWFITLAVVFGLVIIGSLAGQPTGSGSPVAGDATTTSQTPTTPEPTTTSQPGTTSAPASTTPPSTTSTTSADTSSTSATVTSPPSPQSALVLDLLLAIPIELETQSGYNRDLFNVWGDADGDGCDTREEVLIRDAVQPPAIGSGCNIGAGLWYSVYDNVWLNNAQQLQVDHVVALKEAWDSGAKDWDPARRTAFGNDLTSRLTLIAVSSSANSDKGDTDPSNWLPPNPNDVCRYIAAWVVIKSTWDLSMDQSEHGRIRNLLNGQCQGTTVNDAQVVRPPPPATTTTSTAPTTTVAGSADVIIATIRYDGPGNDVVYNDSEYVLLRNNGTGTADVGHWTLTDEANHVVTIPSGYIIQPGGELRVYSGSGDNTADRYFAGFGQAIWNNSGGDTATLRDASGQVVATYSYSS